MERREALKNIGVGSAALFASTALFGSLTSCSPTAERTDWDPEYLNSVQAAHLEKICEAIFPRTSTPGATDAGVANHIDQALNNIYRLQEAENFVKGLNIFVAQYNAHQKPRFAGASTAEVTDVINGYFKTFEEDESKMKAFGEAMRNPEAAMPDDVALTFFVTGVVEFTKWSYFTSELVGETVMRYDPVPGAYDGCIPYEPGQKDWASV